LFEKLSELHLLKRFIDRQKRLSGYENADSGEDARYSFVFGILKSVAITVLCIFLIIVLLFGGKKFTYENAYYMFKEIGYISSFSESRPDTLSYSNPISNQTFAGFKNGLAVAGDSEIKFFTSTGRMTLTLGSSFSNPKLVSSRDYALIYDQGRKSFAVYNSFVELYAEELEYPISYAHMSENGSFCIVTRSKNYGSVVRWYNSDFTLISEYSKNDYVLSACISDNGKYLAVLSLDITEGDSVAVLNVLRKGDSKVYSSTRLYGFMPYVASFISGDRIALVCDEIAVVYDLKCEMKKEIGFSEELVDISFAENGFALLFDKNDLSDGRVLKTFDSKGNEQMKKVIDIDAFDIKLDNNFVYALADGKIVRINRTTGFERETLVPGGAVEIVVISNGSIAVCSRVTAYFVKFD
jgi:hypothetical protein